MNCYLSSYIHKNALIMLQLVLISILIVVCTSCNIYRLKNNIGKFYNQEITLPANMMSFDGEKIPTLDLSEQRPSIVIWFDSTECGTCKMHDLFKYKELELYCQNMTFGPDVLFLFSPKKKKYCSYARKPQTTPSSTTTPSTLTPPTCLPS